MSSVQCLQCEGEGTYFDEGCLRDTCAHGGRRLSSAVVELKRKQEKKDAKAEGRPEVRVDRKTPRVMPCPERVCKCEAGIPHKAKLREKIRLQELELAK